MIAILKRRRHARAVASLVEAILATTEWYHTSSAGSGSRRAVIDGQAITVKASRFDPNVTVRISGSPDIRLGIDCSAAVASHTERYADHQRNLQRIFDAVAARGSAA